MRNVEGTLDIWIDPDNKCYMKTKNGTSEIDEMYYCKLKEYINYEHYINDLGLFQEYKNRKIESFYYYHNFDN